MAKKIWNVMFVAGNPQMFTKVLSEASNPHSRSEALADSEKVAAKGWRVWVEHTTTGERIFESEAEINHKASTAA